MRKITAFLVLLLMAAAVRADFYDLSLSVTIKVYTNGSAHVTERTKLAMDQSSVDSYNKSIYLTELTIMDWQQLTKSKYLRQHIFSPLPRRDLQVTPENLVPYSYAGGTESTAEIRLDYDLDNLVIANYTGPRTTTYTFNSSSFSFESSPSGQVLPANTELDIIIPPDSLVTKISPDPYAPLIQRDYLERVSGLSNFTWRGAISLSSFQLVFVREDPMYVEVSQFFEDIESALAAFLFSAPGLVLIILVVLAVAYLVFNTKR